MDKRLVESLLLDFGARWQRSDRWFAHFVKRFGAELQQQLRGFSGFPRQV